MAPKNHRRCVSCRQMRDRTELWRVVRTHRDRTVTLDTGMGRSAYLCPNAACLTLAQKKKKLARALRAPVPEAIYQQLQQRLPTAAVTQHDEAGSEGDDKNLV